MFRDNPVINNSIVKRSSDPFKIPVSCEDTVSFSASFSLKARINHSGNLQVGHYWTFKKDKYSNKWRQCNDTSITPVQQNSFTNETSYVLLNSQAQ